MKTFLRTIGKTQRWNGYGVLALGLWSALGTSLAQAAPATAPAVQTPVLQAPAWLDEGTRTELSPQQVQSLRQWAENTLTRIGSALDEIKGMSDPDAKQTLKLRISQIVQASQGSRNETFIRYTLNRSLKVVQELESQADERAAGVRDLQIRFMTRSLEMAKRYYQSDAAYINAVGGGQSPDPSTIKLPYAQFGVEYADFLMQLNESVMDASAQYNIAMMALSALAWDLSRDQAANVYAPAITYLYDFTHGILPERASGPDAESVDRLRRIRKAYLKARELVSQADSRIPEVRSSEPSGSLRTGLVALWHFDETSGTTIWDASGNGNTGTLNGGVSLGAPGILNQSAQFNGSTGYVSVQGNNFRNLKSGTIAGWFYLDFGATGGEIIATMTNSSTNRQFPIEIRDSGPLTFTLGPTAVDQGYGIKFVSTTIRSFNRGSWHHFAYTSVQGSGAFHFYVDGVEQPMSFWNGSNQDFFYADAMRPNDNIQIGAKSDQNANHVSYFPGRIDEIAIWNRALQPDEIMRLYRAGANRIRH